MITRARRQPKHRTRLPANFQPSVPAVTWTAAIATLKARITTNIPVVISGLPTGMTVQGVAPTSITMISPTVFDLGYAASVVSTNVLIIDANDPNVRAATGGFLNAGTFTFP
jgi:hypothetical protein